MQILRHDKIAREYDKKYRSNIRNHLKRLRVLLKFIKPKKNSKILEVGVGSGLHLKEMYKTCKNIIGIDISTKMLKEAREKTGVKNLIVADTENMPFKDLSFDMVYTISTLHHTDYKKSISEFSRICKEGGKIGITEPNPLNPQQFFGALLKYSIEKGTFKMFLANLQREFALNNLKIIAKGYAIFIPTKIKNPSKKMIKIEELLEVMPVLKYFAGSNYIVCEKKQSQISGAC